MTTPTTCEATEEQRARSIAAVESWSDARLQGDDLHAAVTQFVAQESARARTDALKAAKEVAAEGRCDCHFAPCPHDEQGKVIAFHIQKLIDNPPRNE